MGIEGHLRDGTVFAGEDARQRFYDARGYGRTLTDAERAAWGANGVALSRVEAAHLLGRGDLDAVWTGTGDGARAGAPDHPDGDRLAFRGFLAHAGSRRGGFLVRFLVYADLRERGFYLSPAREGWPNAGRLDRDDVDFLVYPRGSGPGDGAVEHRIRVVGEREPVAVAALNGPVLAVVDEESDVTYFETRRPEVAGEDAFDPPSTLGGDLLADRAVLWDPPADLYRREFLGRPLAGRDAGRALQLSLVEAAYLAARGAVSFTTGDEIGTGGGGTGDPRDPPALAGVDDGPGDGGDHGRGAADEDYRAAVARGRAVEGDRFDRRLRVYAALRDRGVVPKTGFKFGADFRTYSHVESVDDLDHSELLVRALPAGATRSPRALSLDVRLAHGVRKRMVFALVGDGGSGSDPGDDGDPGIEWRSASRVTP